MRPLPLATRRLVLVPPATRLVAVPLAVLLAVGAALLPPAVPGLAQLVPIETPTARAATDGLTVTTAARYVVMPDPGTVRVIVDLEVRNDRANVVTGGVITRYFYDSVNVGVQPEATRVHATQGGTAVPVHTARRTGYRLVSIGLRGNLYYRQSASVRLVFDLPAGKPRSASDVRVGKAFVTFLAWAYGDSGTVRIEVPRPYTVNASGESMAQTTTADRTILTASTADPLGWYAWIDARDDGSLTREQLRIAGGEEIVVRGWPEDPAWRREVGAVLTKGVPALVDRIGLPWPVVGALNVIEIHAPLLEGYAGFYDPESSEITISEQLDNLTILHEASHAWFNQSLFTERWITEGLANEYARRVLRALGEKVPGPGKVARGAKAAFPLLDWPPPAAIRDSESSAREQYGYDASWTVIRRVVAAVGVDGMQAVFKAAEQGTTAYVGAGQPERSAMAGDWHRFLDLTEELGGASGIDDLLATWVLPTGAVAQLEVRDQARAEYHALLTTSRGWAAPYVIRSAMDRWAFDEAEASIAQASRILAQRDQTEALAAAQGLAPAADLEHAYEAAPDPTALTTAATLAADTESSLEAVAGAAAAAAAPRDWVVSLGLDGADPDGDLAAARSAWTAGDLEGATRYATLATSTLADAPGLGRERAIQIGAGIGAVVTLLVIGIMLVGLRTRRRRHARPAGNGSLALVTAEPGPSPEPDDGGPEAADRYATLAASAPPDAEPDAPTIDEHGAEPS